MVDYVYIYMLLGQDSDLTKVKRLSSRLRGRNSGILYLKLTAGRAGCKRE